MLDVYIEIGIKVGIIIGDRYIVLCSDISNILSVNAIAYYFKINFSSHKYLFQGMLLYCLKENLTLAKTAVKIYFKESLISFIRPSTAEGAPFPETLEEAGHWSDEGVSAADMLMLSPLRSTFTLQSS